MENTAIIRRAENKDMHAIINVLREAGILADGIELSAESFILAESVTDAKTEIAAAIGFEKYGNVGLLRSFVIRKKACKAEDTVKVLGLLLAYARDSGVRCVYLLTESPTLFIHMGFAAVEADSVPDELLRSRHFQHNRKNGVPMRKVLV